MWKEKVSVTPPYHFDRVLDRLQPVQHAVKMIRRRDRYFFLPHEIHPFSVFVQYNMPLELGREYRILFS